jgi:HlyD family secretion protein
MENEVQKLRISKDLKASRRGPSKWLWGLLILVLILIALAWQQHAASTAPKVVSVTRVVMPEGGVSEAEVTRLNATGYIIAAHKIAVASKVIGRVAEVRVERGDRVNQGEVLVRLEDDEYKARLLQQQGILDAAKARLAELENGSRKEEVAQAKAQLDQAQVELDNAQLNLKRYRDLAPSQAVSRQQLDDAESDVRSKTARVESVRQQFELVKAGTRIEQISAQRATVKQAEGALALAQLDVDNCIIKAPIPGTILERNVEVGEFVTTGFVGDKGAKGYVVSMADLNDLRVELDVSQNDFAKTALDQPCWITTDAYPDRKYDGIVDLMSPEANRQKATVQVRVKVLKPDGLLRPDMNATVSFLDPAKLALFAANQSKPEAQRPVIKIPASAIRDNAVFLAKDNKAVKQPITPGETADGKTEIKRGLSGNEDLITNPPPNLKDNDPIKIQNNP